MLKWEVHETNTHSLREADQQTDTWGTTCLGPVKYVLEIMQLNEVSGAHVISPNLPLLLSCLSRRVKVLELLKLL